MAAPYQQTHFPGLGNSIPAIDAHTNNLLEPQPSGDLTITIVGLAEASPPSFVDFGA